MPVLIDGGTIVCETLAILSYLDAVYPEPPFFGRDPEQTALIWQAICECDGNLREPVDHISRPLFRWKGREFSDQINEAAGKVRKELRLLEAVMATTPWIAGDALSGADLVVYPVVMQLLRAAAREGEAELQLGIHPASEFSPKVSAWCQEMAKLPGYENAYPPHWK